MIAGAGTIARAETVDGLRRRRQLVVRALTPLLLFAFLLGLGAVSSKTGEAGDTYTVAVTGELDGAAELLAVLDANPRLTLVDADDAALAAAEETDAALAFTGDADEAWSRGDPVEIVVYSSVSETNSNAAASLVRSLLTREWRDERLAAAGAPSAFDVSVIDVVTTPEGARGTVAQVTAALVVLQAVVLVGGAAMRFGGRQVSGTLTAQLLLPLKRSELLLGKGLGELAVGLTASAPILFLITLVTVVATYVDGGLLSAIEALGAVVLTATVVSFVAVCIGLLIGARSRSAEQSSLYSAFAIVFVAVVVNFFILGEPRGDLTTLLPVAGSAKVLRDVVSGSGNLPAVVVATTTSVLLGLALIWSAARRLDVERLVLRTP